MSHRPINVKKANRLRKALRKTPERFIDLAQYLTDRKLAKSKREARELMLAGKVRVGSHKIGRREINDPLAEGGKRWIVEPHVPAKHQGEIIVVGS